MRGLGRVHPPWIGVGQAAYALRDSRDITDGVNSAPPLGEGPNGGPWSSGGPAAYWGPGAGTAAWASWGD